MARQEPLKKVCHFSKQPDPFFCCSAYSTMNLVKITAHPLKRVAKMENIQSHRRRSSYDKAYVRQNKQSMDDKKQDAQLAELTAHLVNVANNRDKAAYAQLFSYFAPKILNFANQKLATQGGAMDLVQETMTTVWTKAHLFDADKGAVTTWVLPSCEIVALTCCAKCNTTKKTPMAMIFGQYLKHPNQTSMKTTFSPLNF